MKTKQLIKCSICDKVSSSIGLSSHLKYKHDGMKVSEYIARFGDFRINSKKSQELKGGKELFDCKVCNDGIRYTKTALSFHLIKKHQMSKEDYILKNLLDGVAPTCKCGCNAKTKINSFSAPHASEYCSGHNKSTLGYKFSDESKQKMSEVAIGRRNKYRELGIKPSIHQRKFIFERVFGNIQNFLEKLKEKDVKLLSSPDEIYHDGRPLKFQCLKTNSEFSQTSLEVISPFIEKTKSKQQDELVEFIKNLIPNTSVVENTQKVLDNRKEIDVYIPSLWLGIEFDGLYYHSENFGKKNKNYHLWKTENAASKGIRLIHIFEDEWRDKKEIVKRKIKSIIGVPDKKIYARHCEIKSISPTEKNKFLIEHHIQGTDKSDKKYGLFYLGEMVAVMTFSKPNIVKGAKKSDNFVELSRYATKYTVVGGAGKLLANFIREHLPKKIVTYADRRWSSTNNMYEKLGFSYTSNTPVNYFYLDGSGERLHRYNFTKYKIVQSGGDVNKSEWDNMKFLGYDRIWDCGHYRYEMTLD
jgi:hypothetical protein